MTILCYHAIEAAWGSPLAVDPETFAAHARWLGLHRKVVPLAEAVSLLDATGRLPRGTVTLTFDDGFLSVYENAFEELVRHRLPATVFLVAETLTQRGRTVDWVDDPPPDPLRTMNLSQIVEMQAEGVEFASHSYSHRDLTTLVFEDCVSDLRRSRRVLENLLGRPVPFLAYPRGRHNETVREAARRAGYTHGFSLPQGPETPGPMSVPRVGVFPWNGLPSMRVKTTRAYVPLRQGRLFPAIRRVLVRGAGRSAGPRR